MQWIFTLVLVASLRTRLRAAIDNKGRFTTLEECEKAYDALVGHDSNTITGDFKLPPTDKKGPMTRDVAGVKNDAARVPYRPPNANGKVDDDGFDYNDHGVSWDQFGQCSGDQQSPVDIEKYVDVQGQTMTYLWFDYYNNAGQNGGKLENTGHGISFVDPSDDIGFVKIGKDEFIVTGYEFHSPSEHMIDGQVFPLEMQIYHKDRGNSDLTVAISILFKFGKNNTFLTDLEAAAPELPIWTAEHGVQAMPLKGFTETFKLENVLPTGAIHPGGDMTFYNYPGSLTKPPCTENVDWWVSAEPAEATRKQINFIRSAIFQTESTRGGNNRLPQALNDRKVLVGHTGFQSRVKHFGHKKAEAKGYDIASEGYSSQDSPWGLHWFR